MSRVLSFLLIATALIASSALAQDVDWSKVFRFRTSGGFENPGLLVGFNPQPEPPLTHIPTEVDLSETAILKLTIPDIAVSSGGAQIVFAVPEDFSIVAEGNPVGSEFAFQTLGQGYQDVLFDMSTGSGGVPAPGSWVSFNPQPEPPAGWTGIGFQFNFSAFSPAELTVQIIDDGVEPLHYELLQLGDFDEDGDVDQNDRTIWQERYGDSTGADANLDGRVDGRDFILWQRQYSPVPVAIAVPEPTTLLATSWLGFILFLEYRLRTRSMVR